jgi:hypothetical protein
LNLRKSNPRVEGLMLVGIDGLSHCAQQATLIPSRMPSRSPEWMIKIAHFSESNESAMGDGHSMYPRAGAAFRWIAAGIAGGRRGGGTKWQCRLRQCPISNLRLTWINMVARA